MCCASPHAGKVNVAAPVTPPADTGAGNGADADLQDILEGALACGQAVAGRGDLPAHLQSLRTVSEDSMGIAVQTIDGRTFYAGDALVPFSIQSISKLFTLTLALRAAPEEVARRIGCEPSGQPFDALTQLDEERGVPRNPFVNAGALVLVDILETASVRPPVEAVRSFLQTVTGNADIHVDAAVAEEERRKSGRHKAMAFLMESYGNFSNDVGQVLQDYFDACAIRMTCLDLARACTYLANRGVSPMASHQILDRQQTKQVNSLLATCGLYNGAGEFSVRVGLPGKSGIGGGIVAVIPNRMAICTYSPRLNGNGNSLAGIAMLEHLVSVLGCSVF